VTGEDFFPVLVQHLSEALNVDYVLVSEAVGTPPEALQTLAISANQELIPNTNYPLTGTPCEIVVTEAQYCQYPEQVQALFPNAPLLPPMNAESYFGVPLLDYDNNVIGNLCIVHTQPLHLDERTQGLIQVFASRAAAELQRQRAKEALSQAYEELEARVATRTAELSSMNDSLEKEIKSRIATEKALQNNRTFLDQVLNAVADPVFVKNREHRFTMVNDAFCRMLGMSRPAILWKNDADLGVLPSEQVEEFWQFDEQVFTLEELIEKEETLIVNGEAHTLTTKKMPFTDVRGDLSLVGIIQDITDRKRLEEDLRRMAERERNLKEAANAANHAKSEFLANMSHELRTPLNAILGFTQLMQGDRDLSERQQQHIDIINRSGEHLLTLINDVLEMSKIEAGRLELNAEPFDLHYLLENIQQMLSLKAKKKGLFFSIDQDAEVPKIIISDERKLRQVLINLLGNAIKFTAQGHVQLTVIPVTQPIREQDTNTLYLTFTIQDTGPGIAPEEVDNLFQPFTQTQSGRQSREGTGLGLPISAKFVQLMGGEIEVETIPNQGTKFWFTLPVQCSQMESLEPTPSAPHRLSLSPEQLNYRILLVEDKPTNRLLVVKLLQRVGFQVREAVHGQEAIALWQSWQPHLILMDMRMPVMDGYQATAAIRQQERQTQQPSVPIIALTASAFNQEQTDILAAGCNGVVSKPFREVELLAALAEWLDLSLTNDEVVTPAAAAENESYPCEQPTGLDTAIATMPSEWQERLYYAAAQGSDDLLFELIAEIPTHYTALSAQLTQDTLAFKFENIIALVQSQVES
ncbi:MAG: response regulator, partial [Kamptonema sp. SIO4C4]|nr:response regulator [Kamptonema sp. SIO4C4]